MDVRRFENARSKLVSRGYRVKFTDNVYSDIDGSRSSPATQRAEELDSLLSDPDVRYIVSCKGGDYLNEIFEHTDLSSILDSPKWVQGYSDNTDVLFMITTVFDVMSVYCGNFGDYGMEPWHRSVSENLEFIEGSRSTQVSFDAYEDTFRDRVTGLEAIRGDRPVSWRADGDARFSGIALGGCSDKLAQLVGSGRDRVRDFVERYRDDGIVWYMERYMGNRDDVVAGLGSMMENGWFEYASGFLFGRPMFYDGEDYEDAVRSVLGGTGLPLVFDVDVGHKAPRLTMINGARIDVEVTGNTGRITYPDLTEEY